MFRQGDKVIYANYGVCVVSETNVRRTMGGRENTYYVLTPMEARGGVAYVPVEHEELIRPVIGRAEALALIDSMPSIEPDTFNDKNSRTVEDHFKSLLRKKDCAQSMRVAKTMHARMREQELRRHAPSALYARLFEQADRQVKSELSAALDMPESDLEKMLEARFA